MMIPLVGGVDVTAKLASFDLPAIFLYPTFLESLNNVILDEITLKKNYQSMNNVKHLGKMDSVPSNLNSGAALSLTRTPV